MLEGAVGPGYWMGFGFNDPKLTQARFCAVQINRGRHHISCLTGSIAGSRPVVGVSSSGIGYDLDLAAFGTKAGISCRQFLRPNAADVRAASREPVSASATAVRPHLTIRLCCAQRRLQGTAIERPASPGLHPW